MPLPARSLVPELAVRDIGRSTTFYRRLGFKCRYERPEEGFALLALGTAEIMLDEIGRGRTFRVDDAPLDHPLGRGLNLEITVADLAPLLDALEDFALFLPPEEKWYRVGEGSVGVRQFAVADPDGYLLRFSQRLGRNPSPAP